jgi:serine/threonine-protein kinase
VLYEIFTGKRPFDATTSEEMARLRDKSAPTAPSALVKDLDPLVERVILRCLEKDPAKRPASALQVAAALPGGDPLAAALAAGETPSPEMVAASGETEGMRPAMAWTLLAATIVFVVAAVIFSAQAKLYRRVPLEKTPEELVARSRDILKSLGYTEPPVDTAMSFSEGAEFLRYIEDHDQTKTRWDHMETGAFVFWYRGSPRPLASNSVAQDLPVSGMVTANDPPLEVSGMTYVELNPLGQLTQFVGVPPQIENLGPAGTTSQASPDWTPLFIAAGFDPAKWTRTQPQWTPPTFSDARAAWTGTLAERPELPMRIEAAAFHGQPVYFQLVAPWTTPARMQPFQPSSSQKASNLVFIAVQFVILVAGGLFARRNLRLGRGDRHGAARIAAIFFVLFAVAWTLATHHVASTDEFGNFLTAVSLGLAFSVFVWVVYIAMEPYVRRRWPATLVSWSRLLAGNFRDPIVGRDVLAGCLLGAFSIALARFGWYIPGWTGSPPAMPLNGPSWQFLGLRTTIADLSSNAIVALLVSFVFLFVLFIFRALLRKEWAAAIICTMVLTFFRAPSPGQFRLVYFLVTVVLTGITVLVLMRLGLLAVVVSLLFADLLGSFPLTTQTSAWYSYLSFVGFTLVAALLLYGFYISLAGRPIFGGAALED